MWNLNWETRRFIDGLLVQSPPCLMHELGVICLGNTLLGGVQAELMENLELLVKSCLKLAAHFGS